MKNLKAFESFLLDGGIYSPDMYTNREPEDFSPEGAFSVAYINSFANKRRENTKYAKIA